MIDHLVPAGVSPMPAQQYIRRAWPMLPSSAIEAVFRKRDVKRNDQRIGAHDLLQGGDRVLIYLPDALLPQPAQLLYDDGRLIVCLKPQGLPVDVDQNGIGADTLLERLRATDAGIRLCNRLDAATGGLVLAARDEQTEQRIRGLLETHALRKTYLAITKGGFQQRESLIETRLVKDAGKSLVRVSTNPSEGKSAVTRCSVIDDDGTFAHVRLEPVTGRTHQLRCHMAWIGHPILRDDRYGDRRMNQKLHGPLRLWCLEIEFPDDPVCGPWRGRRITAQEPDWWKELR